MPSSTNSERIIVLAHGKIVYTWPLLAIAVFFQLCQLIGADGSWLTWTYVFILSFVMTTVLIDLNRNVILIMGFILLQMLIIWGLVWYAFGINFIWGPFRWLISFDAPYPAAAINTFTFVLGVLWVVDYVNAYLNNRFMFHEGEMFRLRWKLKNRELRLEKVIAEVLSNDWLEVFLWGGDIILVEGGKSDARLELRNVFNHKRVYAKIQKHLPSNVSDK